MLYPIVLSVICLGIVSGMMVYVVPKVIEVFESSKGKLPFATQVLIFVSDFLRNWGIYLVLGDRRSPSFLFSLLAARIPTTGAASTASSCAAAVRPAGARLQHRALHAHVQHPHGQRRAGARSACASPAKW